jgi:hypothetical protein
MMQPPLTPESEGDCQDDLVAQEETVIFLGKKNLLMAPNL